MRRPPPLLFCLTTMPLDQAPNTRNYHHHEHYDDEDDERQVKTRCPSHSFSECLAVRKAPKGDEKRKDGRPRGRWISLQLGNQINLNTPPRRQRHLLPAATCLGSRAPRLRWQRQSFRCKLWVVDIIRSIYHARAAHSHHPQSPPNTSIPSAQDIGPRDGVPQPLILRRAVGELV